MGYEDTRARAREGYCRVAGTAPLAPLARTTLQQVFLNEEPSCCPSKNKQTSFPLFKESPSVSGHPESLFVCLSVPRQFRHLSFQSLQTKQLFFHPPSV